MVIANDKTFELVGHQVTRIVTLTRNRSGGRMYTSHRVLPCFPKAASVITAPSSFSYSSSSETAGACDWQRARTQRVKKLIICSDVRDSELENIRLSVSSLYAITDLTTCAGCSFFKARYTAPTPQGLHGIHHLTRCFHMVTITSYITLIWALVFGTFPKT